MGPIQNLHELLSWMRRRWKIVLLFSVIGALGGVVLALQSERVYNANAVIQVINPVVVASTEEGGDAAPDVTRRVQMIEQRLMSREALLDLAARHHLFDGMPLSPVEQVALMRQSYSITSIAAAQQGFSRDGSLSALIVSASDDDPQVAAAIANELADQLVQQSVDARQSNAQQALDFFRSEEDRLEAAIHALEDEIAAFRSANEGFLTDAVALRRSERARLIDGLRDLQAELSARQSELDTLDLTSTRIVIQRQIEALQEEIAQLEQQEAEMRGRINELMQGSSAGMWNGTFHGLCHRMLRAHYLDARLPDDFNILDSDDQMRLLRRLIKAQNLDEKHWPARQAAWARSSPSSAGSTTMSASSGDISRARATAP